MKTIPVGNKIALVDDQDYEMLSCHSWSLQSCGYASIGKRIGDKRTTYMHRMIFGDAVNGKIVDHINHNTLDNRRENLRIVTKQQNHMNMYGHKNSVSKYKGVWFCKQTGKWGAELTYYYKKIWLGRYAKEVEAAKAYNEAAKKYFGEYALLNEIPV